MQLCTQECHIRLHNKHSNNKHEPSELSKWLSHDDSTINIVIHISIIIIIIIIIIHLQQYNDVMQLYGSFPSWLMSDPPRDTATLTFDLGGHGTCWMGLHAPSAYQVRSS